MYVIAMAYPYEDLHDRDFEKLVVEICRQLFGLGVQPFAAGKDGGRDAWFRSTAENYPSKVSPWSGTTIIQAKHTIGINARFSDQDFSGTSKSSVLTEEMHRVKELVRTDGIDNYMLFSNRRLTGVAAPQIISRISNETGISPNSISLQGIDDLNTYLHHYPNILELARIDPMDGPLRVSSYEIADVILALSEVLDGPLPERETPPEARVSYSEKNATNNMSEEFADELSNKYLLHTYEIEKFLAAPENTQHVVRYQAAVNDFQLKIVAYRPEFLSFDKLFIHLVDTIVKQEGVLKPRKSNLHAMLFYMYWHCDIGKKSNASTK